MVQLHVVRKKTIEQLGSLFAPVEADTASLLSALARALATSGVTGPEMEFIPFVADLMDNNPEFVDTFKPQELANIVWYVNFFVLVCEEENCPIIIVIL